MPGQISMDGFPRFIFRVCWFSVSSFIIKTPSPPALTRSYPCCFTFYVAHLPHSSFILISASYVGRNRRGNVILIPDHDAHLNSSFLLLTFDHVLPRTSASAGHGVRSARVLRNWRK